MKTFVVTLTKNQLLREMLVIKEAIRDAETIQKRKPCVQFSIGQARKNLNIVVTEYKSRFKVREFSHVV